MTDNRKTADRRQLDAAIHLLADQLDRANIGYWGWGTGPEHIYWSASCKRLFGIPDTDPLTYSRFLASVHPDDRHHVGDAVLSCADSVSPKELDIEFRSVMLEGTERWIHMKGGITEKPGEAIRMAGIALDITRRKQSEETASHEHARLQAVLEQLPQGVIFAAPGGEIVLVNDQAERITGHHFIASEGLEQYGQLKAYHADGRPYAPHEWPLFRTLESGEVVRREAIVLERPDSTIVHLEASATPIGDDRGRIVAGVMTFEDITAHKLAAEALKTQGRLLQTVTDNASVALIITDAHHHCVFMNPAAVTLTGYTIEELRGRTLHEVVHSIHPDGRGYPISECPIDQAYARRRPMSGEELFVHKSGRFFNVAYTASPLLDDAGFPTGTVIELQDITDRKRAEDALRERENRLRLALSGGQMGTWDVDLNSDETTWDDKEYQLLGYSREEIPSRTAFYARVHPDDRQRVKEAVRRAIAMSGELEHQFRIVRPDGEVRWLASKGIVLKDLAGHPSRLVGINHDITDHKRSEEELRSFAQQLEARVAERTEALVHSQERLRALAAELNLAEQRERKRLAVELHDHLQQLLVLAKLRLGQGVRNAADVEGCVTAMKQVDGVLTDALNYTRTLVSELSPQVLHDHGLAAALKWLGTYMDNKYNLKVTVTVPEDGKLKLPEDQGLLLLQSVRELLINSWKYAGTGQAEVILTHDRVLRIEVRDHGKGFEMAATATPSELSSKFGLFSIRERMRTVGGVLEVRSAPGRGTSAVLELPINRTPGAAAPLARAPIRTVQESAVTNSHVPVLLVDDHAMVRQGLRSVLEAYPDIRIVGEAANGEEAAALAEALRPRVIVMDVNMPKVNGIEATKHITSRFPAIIIVGISVNAGGEDSDAMARAGAATLLTKEAAADRLYAAIQQALATHSVTLEDNE